MRYLVRQGNEFFVSRQAVKTLTPLLFDSEASDGEWAAVTPETLLSFDSTTANFAPQNFTDITAVGFIASMSEPSVELLKVQMNLFRVSLAGASTTTLATSPRSSAPSAGMAPVLRCTRHSLLLSAPFIGEASLFDLRGRPVATLRAEGGTTLQFARSLSAGWYLLQLRQLNGQTQRQLLAVH
jgi:hypothetical protein